MIIGNIQALRFFAALLVVFGHAQHEAVDWAFGESIPDFIRWGFGVDIFFVISGFVMYLTAADRFGKRGAFWAFAWKRIVRVVPIYWVFTTLALLSMVLFPAVMRNDSIDPVHALLSYLFIPYPRPGGDLNPILSLGWTLNYEMFFYGAFALALLVRRSIGIPVLAASFIAFAIVHPLIPDRWAQVHFWTRPIILEFIAGIALAIVYCRGVRVSGIAALAAIAAGLLMVALLPGPRWLHSGAAAALVTAGVVLFRDLDYRGMVGKAIVAGGDASYALYLSHPFAINGLGFIWRDVGLPGFATVATLGAIVTSLAVHRYLERPLLRAMSRNSRPGAQRTREESAG